VIADAGVPVVPVEELTGFPECLDGRVKTLHPRVHAGLLADRRRPEHVAQLAELGVAPFDLLVSNLYPFRETVAALAVTVGPGAASAHDVGGPGGDTGGDAVDEALVEQIDIGGPAMVRAAAKNHASVAVVVEPERYGEVLDAVRAGGFTLAERRALAARAFAHTAAYDAAVANWFAGDELPDGFGMFVRRAAVLRYGENPHQRAALYVDEGAAGAGVGGLAGAEQLHGKEMSYNNYVDTDAALRAANDFAQPCVAIIKHANPCGIAVADEGAADPVAEAHRKAHACDPVSAFGGVIAVNRPVTVAMAEQVAEVFTEVIAAPSYEDGALEVLTRKKNIRVLRCALPGRGSGTGPSAAVGGAAALELRQISGGLLAQTPDRVDAPGDDPSAWRLVAGDPVDDETLADLVFAWRAVRAVKSNAILLARGGATVGVGMGQVNRVDSARLAVARAGERAVGAVAASDAYFPFPDGLQVLLDAGVRAVVQPGGSVRDELSVEAARAAGVPMYFTGTRHFFH
jgi:phosphoribosylaminoimidazolecarboxamide formyltransferase / IMP cyclohydrolase